MDPGFLPATYPSPRLRLAVKENGLLGNELMENNLKNYVLKENVPMENIRMENVLMEMYSWKNVQ